MTITITTKDKQTTITNGICKMIITYYDKKLTKIIFKDYKFASYNYSETYYESGCLASIDRDSLDKFSIFSANFYDKGGIKSSYVCNLKQSVLDKTEYCENGKRKNYPSNKSIY